MAEFERSCELLKSRRTSREVRFFTGDSPCCQTLTMFGERGKVFQMATKTMNISLTPELRTSIDRRLRSGLYGNASDVIRAGLRALSREEMAVAYQEWRKVAADLPQEPATPKIESRIERAIQAQRRKRNKRRT